MCLYNTIKLLIYFATIVKQVYYYFLFGTDDPWELIGVVHTENNYCRGRVCA